MPDSNRSSSLIEFSLRDDACGRQYLTVSVVLHFTTGEWTWFVIKGVRAIRANVVALIERIILLQ